MNASERKRTLTFITTFFIFFFFCSCSTEDVVKTEKQLPVLKMDGDTIAIEMEQVLKSELALWYPLSLDTSYGGFFSDINYKWELDGQQKKMIVTQARHVWSTANAAMFYQKDNVLRGIAGYGVEFLKHKMWDQEYGGFYDLVNRYGEPLTENGQIIKRAYGNAFAIYGLAAYSKISGDTSALRLAQEAFHWLEEHSYDAKHGGYFQFLSREGIPFTEGYEGVPPKDYNSMIHLLECFTELYKVWPVQELKERLNSMLQIICDTFTTDKGYMLLYFSSDWIPFSYRDSSFVVREKNHPFDYVSFGHDVETAYLILEASETLGLKNDTTTLSIAKKMVDHVLANGWDQNRGGIYDGGFYSGNDYKASIVRNTKEWWAQVEALNSLLMMSDLFPHDKQEYYKKFCIQWEYCKKYLIDDEYGGWYWGGVDIVPENRYSSKGSIWKGNYHTSRALINCIKRLKSKSMNYVQ